MQQVMHQSMLSVTALTTGSLQLQMTDCGQELDMHQDMQIRLTLEDRKDLDSCWQCNSLQTVCFFSFIFRALPRKHATAGNNTFMFLSLSVQSNNGKLHERSCKVKAKEPLFVE
jgi:hypothetical protein